MCVFAMFGATAYGKSSDFRTFSKSLYTMFRTLCLDGWNQIIETVEFEQPQQPVPVKAFFIIYIFVVVYVLIPVFVAAILDGYRTATYMQSRTEQRKLRKKVALDSDNEVTMSIDSILHSLISCATSKHLDHKLDILFDVIDTDEGGGVSFEEMRNGFLKLSGGNSEALSLEEFEAITRGGEYLNECGEVERDGFKQVMGEQLRTYVQRKLAQYIIAVGKEDPSQELIFFALKSLATDSGSLVDFRHNPIAMCLQVQARARAFARPHACTLARMHARTPARPHARTHARTNTRTHNDTKTHTHTEK
jgi:Ca2+-binding EF-hand superfamily protein